MEDYSKTPWLSLILRIKDFLKKSWRFFSWRISIEFLNNLPDFFEMSKKACLTLAPHQGGPGHWLYIVTRHTRQVFV